MDETAPNQTRHALWGPHGANIARAAIAIMLSMLIALAGLLMNQHNLALVDTLDKHVGDWRIALASPRAATQRPDIAVVLITDDTLLDYQSSSPIDRGMLAELVRVVDASQPKAIGLDIIFDRSTRSDTRLVEALKSAKAPIVLGAIDERIGGPPQSLARQAEFLAATGRPSGHVMLERKMGFLAKAGDSTVRLVAGPAGGGSSTSTTAGATRALAPGAPSSAGTSDAFVDVLAQAAGVSYRPNRLEISWLRAPSSAPLFMTLRIPQHDPDALKPLMAGVFLDSWRELLKGRIVIVGASLIDRDKHSTPLSVVEGIVPGVMIHAQALAQRIDGNRDIQVWPWWVTFLVATGVALACFATARHTGLNPQGFAYGVLGLCIIGTASFLVYLFWRIDIPSIALTAAWLGGGFGGFLSGWLYRKLGVEI